ncbi:MAG: nucleotide sugar dehydrogenase [Lentisphaeria bacterium]|nr:nucleotide sugar dehydrogenase [Lentisphaeria bacterium]
MREIRKVAIIGGCGHVGIPLGLALADRGFIVTLLDINKEAVNKLNSGKLPFIEEGAENLLQKYSGKNLFAVTDPAILKEQHCVIFVTGTPVDEHLNAKVHAVLDVVKEYLPFLSEDQLIILRSTLYPGTVRIVENMLLRHDFKCKLAFCPERILQGKGIKEIFELPQLISGCTKEAEKEAASIFEKVAKKTILLTPEEAELAKLMTNSWRYLEFAIANQFYMIAEDHGVDFYKVYNAMTDDYPRAKHFPRPGLAAGPCLFKDTMQLASYHDNKFFLGHSAMLVNEGLPNLLVEQLAKKMGGSLKNRKIAILGMTFKANNDDTRESLSFKIKKLLEQKMAYILPSDPYLKDTLPLEEALKEAEGIIIGTPHDEYKSLSLHVPFADCWGIIHTEQ